MLKRHSLAVLLALAMVLATVATAAAAPSDGALAGQQAETDCIYFEATQQSVCFGFKAYWEKYGGLAIFGYPITGEFVENGVTVQYFERARFERHPGVWPARYDVLQGLLGAQLAGARLAPGPFAREQAVQGCTFFEATGHSLCSGFQSYWQTFGGLAIFGYPISEEFVEDGVTVQYFERARFEWHPGVWPERYDVLLGLLGVRAISGEQPAPEPEPEPEPEPPFVPVAAELNNPRGMTIGPDGAIYVAEAGAGGDGPCLPNPEGEGEVCYGPTG